MASRKLTDLHPAVYKRANAAAVAWEKAGLSVIVTCTLRNNREQIALYSQGRNPQAIVNNLRLQAGLPPISIQENSKIITNAKPGESMHEYGLAFDIVPLSAGKCIWDVKNPVWMFLGKIGKEAGLEWAGDWKTFKEYPHFQFTRGCTLQQIQNGQRPMED